MNTNFNYDMRRTDDGRRAPPRARHRNFVEQCLSLGEHPATMRRVLRTKGDLVGQLLQSGRYTGRHADFFARTDAELLSALYILEN